MKNFFKWVFKEVCEFFLPLIPLTMVIILSLVVVNIFPEEYAMKIVGVLFLAGFVSFIFIGKKKR